MSSITLSDGEAAELYVMLKPREGVLTLPLAELLLRIEKSLYERLTIDEMEQLCGRFEKDR
jgi:hypothetical protein